VWADAKNSGILYRAGLKMLTTRVGLLVLKSLVFKLTILSDLNRFKSGLNGFSTLNVSEIPGNFKRLIFKC
jgi:hypothetical protein